MRKQKDWKRIAAILMTTALLTQGQSVLASETEVPKAVQAEAVQEKNVEAEAPQTEAPATETPQTEAPATEMPQTEAPQTEAPQTEAPATEAPQTETPATEAPQTEAPATEAPQTEAPQTETPATEAPQTEAPSTEVPQTEVPQAETPETEAPKAEEPKEKETEAEKETEIETESETEEAGSYKTSFRYENSEVIIEANASEEAQFPENAEMRAERLQPGTPAYEEARRAAEESLGTRENAEYLFYDVTFLVDGRKVEAPAGTVTVQIRFKTVQADSSLERQSVLHIQETGGGKLVQDVTAPTAAGSSMSSVNFAL